MSILPSLIIIIIIILIIRDVGGTFLDKKESKRRLEIMAEYDKRLERQNKDVPE